MSYANIYPYMTRILDSRAKKITPFGIANKGIHPLSGETKMCDTWQECRSLIGVDETAKRLIERKLQSAQYLMKYHGVPQHVWYKCEHILTDRDVVVVNSKTVRLGKDFNFETLTITPDCNLIAKQLFVTAITRRQRVQEMQKRNKNFGEMK